MHYPHPKTHCALLHAVFHVFSTYYFIAQHLPPSNLISSISSNRFFQYVLTTRKSCVLPSGVPWRSWGFKPFFKSGPHQLALLSGWWFQTFGLFSMSYMGCHPSHWRTHIFQGGRYTTQPVMLYPNIGFQMASLDFTSSPSYWILISTFYLHWIPMKSSLNPIKIN